MQSIGLVMHEHHQLVVINCFIGCTSVAYSISIVFFAISVVLRAIYVTDIRLVYVFVLSYTSYFQIVEVKYG